MTISAMLDRQLPLSVNQDQQLFRDWIAHTRSEQRAPFVGWMGLEFDTKPDIARLERALNTMVQRHEILRTAFTEPSSVASSRSEIFGRLKELPISASLFDQRVQAEAPLVVSQGALDGLERDPVSRAVAHDVLRTDLEKGFRYDAAPLVRATVFKCDGGRHLLSIAVSHLVTDGFSMRVFRRELAALYRHGGDPAALPPLEAQYSDFAVWQRQQLATGCDAAISYWREQWTEFVPAFVRVTEIPYSNRVEAAAMGECGREAVSVDDGLTSELRAFCRRHGVTMYIAWLAATAITLRLYTGRPRVALMAPIANRTQPQWQPLIGWFSNVFICGLEVSAASGQAVLGEARRTIVGAIENQIVPLSVTWRALIRQGTIPRDFYIPDVISLDYTTVPREPAQKEPWRRPVWSYIARTHKERSMAIRITDGGRELTLVCAYPIVNFSSAGARQVLNDIQGVMRALLRSPEEPIEAYRHVLGAPSVQTA